MVRAINYDALCKLAPDEQGWTFTVTTKKIPDDYEERKLDPSKAVEERPPQRFPHARTRASVAASTTISIDDDRRDVKKYATSQMHALGRPVGCTFFIRLESHDEYFKLVLDTGSHDTWIFSNFAPKDQQPSVAPSPTYIPNLYWAETQPIAGLPFHELRTGNGHPTERKGRSSYVDETYVEYNIHRDEFLKQDDEENDKPEFRAPFEFGAVTGTWFGASATRRRQSDRSFLDFDGILGLAPHDDGKAMASLVPSLLLANQIVRQLATVFPLWASDLQCFPSVTFLFDSLLDDTESHGNMMIFGRTPVADGNNDWNRVFLVLGQGTLNWVIPSPSKRINNAIHWDEYGAEHGMAIDTGTSMIYLKNTQLVDKYFDAFTDPSWVKKARNRYYLLETAPPSQFPRLDIQLGANGEYLTICPSSLLGRPSRMYPGWRLANLQTTPVHTIGSGLTCDILGLAGMRSALFMFQYPVAPQVVSGGQSDTPQKDNEGDRVNMLAAPCINWQQLRWMYPE